jgi:drug/metabolite transporter (DMT)-like permease
LIYKAQLRWRPVAILLALALIWGANMALIKIGGRELPFLFMAGFRSLIASLCLYIWMRARGIVIFPTRAVLLHGIAVGLMFGTEFGFIYLALDYNPASRVYIFLYTAPFFTALGAHFLLRGDRLNRWKAMGLVAAFTGVLGLFADGLTSSTPNNPFGDTLSILGGALWGLTTVYIKKYLTHRTVPLQTLFYQLLFSIPVLLGYSLVMEPISPAGLSFATWFSLFYQSIIVAFLSYLVWFELIHRYPVSLLHAFSFFTPVFGVFISGALILGEKIDTSLYLALILVSLGMVFVNYQPEGR